MATCFARPTDQSALNFSYCLIKPYLKKRGWKFAAATLPTLSEGEGLFKKILLFS